MFNHKVPVYSLVILRKDGKVLLLKRGPNAAYAPNQYCMVGGAVEKLETFRDAIVREAKEEVGISINQEDLKFAHVFYKRTGDVELVVCAFECSVWEGMPYNVEPHKHTELLWASEENLPNNMVVAHRNALEYVKNNHQYSECTEPS